MFLSYDVYETKDGAPRKVVSDRSADEARSLSRTLTLAKGVRHFPSPKFADKNGDYVIDENLEIVEVSE